MDDACRKDFAGKGWYNLHEHAFTHVTDEGKKGITEVSQAPLLKT